MKRPIVATRHTMIPMSFPRLSLRLNVIYGSRANERKNPNTKPMRCAQLSTIGSKPITKSKKRRNPNFATAIPGLIRMYQFCMISTKRQASSPNCDPDGPAYTKKLILKSVYYEKGPQIAIYKTDKMISLYFSKCNRDR